MPVTVNEKGKTVREHRACVTAVIEEHIKENREDLVNAFLMTAAVAKLIPRSEVASTPEAKKALDVEWEKPRSKGTWDELRVKECKTVIAEAKAKGEKAHIARIFEACYLKGSKLAVGDPSPNTKAEPFSKDIVWLMRTMSKRCLLNLGLVSSKGMQSKHTRRHCSKASLHG